MVTIVTYLAIAVIGACTALKCRQAVIYKGTPICTYSAFRICVDCYFIDSFWIFFPSVLCLITLYMGWGGPG
jgi:hypothetical protein